MVSLRTAIPVYKTSSCYTQWISLRQNIMGASGLLTTQVRMKLAIENVSVSVCVCVLASRRTPRRTAATPKSSRDEGTPKTTPKSACTSASARSFTTNNYYDNTVITVMVIIITIIVHNMRENENCLALTCRKLCLVDFSTQTYFYTEILQKFTSSFFSDAADTTN